MHNGLSRQSTPLGMAISAGKTIPPTDSATKAINVLSEPHLPTSISPRSILSNAATRLQKTLDKSDTKTFVDLKVKSDGLSHSPTRMNTSDSGASMRVATTAARDIVAGLFRRHRKSNANLADGVSVFSRSPMSGSAKGLCVGDFDDEYLYGPATHAPAPCSPGCNPDRCSKPSHQKEQEPVSYTNFASLSSLPDIQRSPYCPIRSTTPPNGEMLNAGSSYVFPAPTLTQRRCDNRIRVTRVSVVHPKPPITKSRRNVHEIFMSDDCSSISRPIPLSLSPRDTEYNNDTTSAIQETLFHSPVKSLIRQSSTCSSLSNVIDFPAISSYPETSIHGSGRVALTNVLTSPKFGKVPSKKITSLSLINYKLPDSKGYISFPPFVPSSYFGGSLANIFGCNENSNSCALNLDGEDGLAHETTPSYALRKTLTKLASQNSQPLGSSITVVCDQSVDRGAQ